MRILQLIPAFLLAATTSFVSAAAIDARSSADITFSSVPRSSNDAAALQAINDAAKQMGLLNKQIAAARSAGTLDPAAVSNFIGKMNEVVSTANTQFQPAHSVDMSGLWSSPGFGRAVDSLLGGLLGGLLSLLGNSGASVDSLHGASADDGSFGLLGGLLGGLLASLGL